MAKKTRPSIEELRKLEERLAASELALRQATAREQALREELTADRERTEAARGDVRIAHESLLAALRSVAESERRSRAIGEPLPFGIWVSDPEGGLIYLSESFLVMMGLSMEDARGFGWTDKVSPGLRERAVADWKRCVETGTFWDHEYIVRGENGKERFVLSLGMPLRDAQGRVIAWAGINLDITESKRAQQVVADAVVYAEAIVETVREPLVVLTADLRVDSANPAFYNAFNVTAEETAHRPIYHLGNGQWNIPRLRELLERVIPGNGQVDDFEVEQEFPTIGRRSMLLNARRIVRQATAEPFILLAIEDITERKRATAEVGHLAAVVESSEDAIFSITLDGVVVSWNVGAQQLYGYRSDEMVGKSVSILIPPDRPDELPRIFERVKRGERIARYETVRVHKDGDWLQVSVTDSPVRDDVGRIIGIAAIDRDITEQKRAEQFREEYVALISHDLRSPLTTILGQADLLRRILERLSMEREAKSAAAMATSARRMNGMIQELVDSARLEAGRMEMRKEPTDLPGMLYDLLGRFGTPEERARIVVETPEYVPAVPADRQHVERAVTNLLTNALKYSPASTPIVVHVGERDGRALISVSDQGVGIPAEDVQHIFERHFRARTAGQREGLGLGLYITRLIVEAHRGRVWVESEVGKGSTFYIALPLS